MRRNSFADGEVQCLAIVFLEMSEKRTKRISVFVDESGGGRLTLSEECFFGGVRNFRRNIVKQFKAKEIG